MAIRITAEPDPILAMPWRVRGGMDLSEFGRRELRNLVCDPDHDNWCKEEMPTAKARERGDGVCSRPKGHPAHWKHVAATRYSIIATWGGGDPPNDGEFVDPEDGTTEDPPEAVAPVVEIGGVYRLKDRKNILLVIGGVGDDLRDDGQIDVLDFTKREYRAVPPGEIVIDPTAEMSPEDFLFSIEYGQQARMKIKNEAIENYHAGRWCEAGLQDALRDLGLPKYVPTQTGEVVIRVPYTADSDMSTTKVKELVAALAKVEELKAALATVDPEDDDELKLKADQVSVKVANVGRR